MIIKSPAGEFPITIERFEVEQDERSTRFVIFAVATPVATSEKFRLMISHLQVAGMRSPVSRSVERAKTHPRALQAPGRRIAFAADPAHGFAMATCPICKAEAEEIESGTFVDGVWFRCLKHREFGVSDTALKARKDAEPEQWERALKKATERAGEGNRPKILDLDF